MRLAGHVACNSRALITHLINLAWSSGGQEAAARETGELEEILAPAPAGCQNRQCSDYLSRAVTIIINQKSIGTSSSYGFEPLKFRISVHNELWQKSKGLGLGRSWSWSTVLKQHAFPAFHLFCLARPGPSPFLIPFADSVCIIFLSFFFLRSEK